MASWGSAVNGFPHIAVGNVIGNTIISICFCFALPAIFFEISFEKIHKWILLSLPIFGLWIILYLIFPQLRIVFGILAILSYVGFIVINIVSKDPLKAPEFEEKEEEKEKKIYVSI